MIQRKKINWALMIGAILVGFMTFLAVFGPSFSPQNPMEENYTLKVDGSIRVPPYPAFKVEGYPLGTDRYGRDILSRILWAVRPTMIMVVTVASVRLVLGLVLGMLIGWSEGRRGRFLESLLSTALSIPVLIAALIGIFMVGADRGLWAFIFGLGLTGWAESARMVSEQTRMIKTQTFVEAARALGASDRRILYSHVLRQIMSLLWMLLAFEISSTLLISAELGFLDYFIGGGVWVEISDFKAVNVAGLPELGQMISTSLVKLTDPAPLIIVGSVIGMGVLGFNLLGEGLRLQLSQEWLRGGRRFRFLSQSVEEWIEERLLRPVLFWAETHRTALVSASVILLLLFGSWMAFKSVYVKPLAASGTIFETTATKPLWGSDRHDAYGTLWVSASLNTEPKLIWNVPLEGGAAGKPSISADGTIYVSSTNKILTAIDPNGKIIWESPLDEIAVGAPALTSDGRVIVADSQGYITSFDVKGNRLWRLRASTGRQATSGPIVDAQGNIYVTLVDTVAALSPEGKLLWRTVAAETYLEEPPRLSPDQKMIFLKNSVMQIDTGALIEISFAQPQDLLFTDPAYFSGANGANYFRLGHEIIGWHLEDNELIIDSRQTWAHEGTVLLLPYDQGVTQNGLTWFYYTMMFVDTRVIWLDAGSRVVGNYSFLNPNPKVIAIGSKGEAYLCGATTVNVDCVQAAPGADKPTWELSFESPSALLGGAVIPNRLYLLLDGGLYAFESQETQP
ncbi:MAG: PQQ-binding-like beta-propeller repeat protein [Chloroflexi bacterium]|nr:PQQ-binding-like beta-propeller repeat protein [Chloroflexota bacterium]